MFETFVYLLLTLVYVIQTVVTAAVFVMALVILAMAIAREVTNKGEDRTQDKDLT